MKYKEWDQLSEKEQLLQYISDEHKSAYGFRPRGSYDHLTVVELRAELTYLNEEANRIYEEEQAHAKDCAVEYEKHIQSLIDLGASSRQIALWWDLDGDDYFSFEYPDVEHYVWNLGFLFSDDGLALFVELTELLKVSDEEMYSKYLVA